MLQHVSIGL